jgi:cell division septation protein DedD
VSLPAGSFDVWFEDESGELVYPKYVTPYFETEPTCSEYATEESITILKPPGSGPRCDDLIHNGDFTIGMDGWQDFKGKFDISETAGADGAAALIFEEDGGHLSQWLDMTCLEEGVYEFRTYYKVVDQIDNIDSARDITEASNQPGPMLKFMEFNDDQRLKGLTTLKPDIMTEDPLPKDKVGNNGALNYAQSLGRCQGDCDRDMDCMPGLVCFRQNNVPIPGCIGQSSNTEYCIDPYTHELSGFHLLWGSFTVTPEAASADALRLVFANTKTGLILDKISLRKAPWSQSVDDTPVPTEAPPAPTDAPSKKPTVSPTKAPSKKPTSSPTVPPTKAPSKKPTSSPTVSPTKSPTASPTNKPTMDPLLLEQALAIMKHIIDTMQPAFESSITLPILGSDLDLLFYGFASDVELYAGENFPDGISNLDNYDDDLPESMPSFEEYISTVLSALEQQYDDANTAAIAAAVQAVKDDWNKKVEDALEVAVKVATAIKSNDIENDDPLPYLDAAANEMLKSELTEAIDNYGDTVLSCAAVDSMLV